MNLAHVSMILPACGMIFMVGSGCSCSGNEKDPIREWPPAPPEAIPASVEIPASTMTIGTKTGTIRRSRSLPSYAISRSPVTVAQYRLCVSASVCSGPAWGERCGESGKGMDGPTFESEIAEVPVTCVSSEQAALFCQWVGQRLPTSDEWALAARGPDVTQYAWGDDAPDCNRHYRTSFVDAAESCCGVDCASLDGMSVGKHPEGQSPFGVVDVLSTRGEFLGADSRSTWPVCQPPRAACIVTGMYPAAIDTFASTPSEEDLTDDNARLLPIGFRCAHENLVNP